VTVPDAHRPAGPRAVPDPGSGPAIAPGVVVDLAPGLARLTAPNPSLMTGPGTNTYLIGTTDVAVLDPGPVIESHQRAIADAVAARGGTIRWVAVTHHHPDHAPGAAAVAAAAGVGVIGFGPVGSFVPDRRVGDGWVLSGPDFSLRAVHTPGHASDHLCWLLEEHALLLSGDHVMQGSTVVIHPPDGDMATYLASLRLLQGDGSGFVTIAPGHGRLIANPAEVITAIVDHRLEREQVVAAALAALGAGTVDDLLASVYADVAPAALAVARFSLWAHLLKLAADGRALGASGDGTDPRTNGLDATWRATERTLGAPLTSSG
jgi:glyoxylase-like metal-dependent hydrolase (beta-lactamase superfamily II)